MPLSISKIHFFSRIKQKLTPKEDASRNFIIIGIDSVSVFFKGRLRKITSNITVLNEKSLLELIEETLYRLNIDSGDKLPVTVALPPAFFLFTHFQLIGIEENKVKDGLLLQIPTILPGMDKDYLLAEMDYNYNNDSGVSLWMNSLLADQIVEILSNRNILVERITASIFLSTKLDNVLIEHVDTIQKTLIHVKNNCLHDWHVLTNKDNDTDFIREYEQNKEELSSRVPANGQITITDGYNYKPSPSISVFFVPKKTLARKKIIIKKRLTCLSVFLFLTIALSPFLLNMLLISRKNRLTKKLAAMQQDNIKVAHFANEISQFEQQWGVVIEFPKLDIAGLLTLLNEIIPNDTWLISMSLDKDVIELTGYSPDPERILTILSNQNIFSDVSYSQAVYSEESKQEKNFFAIYCTISGVDIEAYLTKYFGEDGAL